MCLDPAAFWATFGTLEEEPLRLEPWQVWHLRDYSRFRAREKAPQIGFSLLCAAEAVWEGLMFSDATSGMISVDQREASEKILYGRKLYDGLPEPFRRAVPMEGSTEELRLGGSGRPSRILSLPSTAAMRGRRMNVYLDEEDFYRDGGAEANRAALGRVARGGRLTKGSTCFGSDTDLDRTMQGSENYSRARLPHTVATDPEIRRSVEIARQELPPEDFAEEYECVRGGGEMTFAPELIRGRTGDHPAVELSDLEPGGPPLVVGYDVGGTGHPSVACGLEKGPGDRWRQVVLEEIRGQALVAQERALADALRRLPQMVLVIDQTGIGMQATQTLGAAFGRRVVPMHPGSKPAGLPPQDKVEMTLELRRGLEGAELELVADRLLAQQMRKTRIAARKVTQPGTRKRTHYDRYWALAYAWYGVRAGIRRRSRFEDASLHVVDAWGRITEVRPEAQGVFG